MSLYDLLDASARPSTRADRLAGVAVGVVTNNKDPENLGRVRLRFPWFADDRESEWARVVTLMAGKDRGTVFMPEVDDEVLVAFEMGDMRRPYVIGALWNGVDTMPAEFANDGNNHVRFIKSRSGLMITLDDTDRAERVVIADKDMKNSIIVDVAMGTITIHADADLALEAPQGKISLNAREIEVASTSAASVKAGSEMKLEASATLTVKGTTVNIN